LRDLHAGDALKGVVNHKENIMRLLRNSVHGVLVLAAMAVALAPKVVLADHDHGVSIKGTFTVSFMRPAAPSAVTGPYCANGGIPIEAQGIGSVSRLGPLFLTVKKCATVVGSAVTYAGTFKMTAGNGDSLNGTYAGTQDNTLRDENGYVPFQGTLTFAGGTGRLSHASGVLSFTAVATPVSVGVTAPTVNGMAYYLVNGNMLSHEER
jgi:hypothetical protein